MAEAFLLQVSQESITYAENVVTMSRVQIESELAQIRQKAETLSSEILPDLEEIKNKYDAEKEEAIVQARMFIDKHNSETTAIEERNSLLQALLTEIKKQTPVETELEQPQEEEVVEQPNTQSIEE